MEALAIPESKLDALIFDLDGVIRHYDRTHEADIERRFGLDPGTLTPTAFGGDLGRSFMCGVINHDQFAESLGQIIKNAEAANEYVAMRAVIDPEAVELVSHLQTLFPVALLTNGSTRTRQELAESGLDLIFEHIFNSAETRVPKPEPEAYLGVLRTLDVAPQRACFVDDHPKNVDGAVAVGLHGHHYQGLSGLREFLHGFGVPAPQ